MAGKADNVEYNRHVIELQQALIATQRDMQTLVDENTQLRNELAGLQSRTFHHAVEWTRNVDGQEDGPFCSVCRANGKEMPLQFKGHAADTATGEATDKLLFKCPIEHLSGRGREAVYPIPKTLVRANRY